MGYLNLLLFSCSELDFTLPKQRGIILFFTILSSLSIEYEIDFEEFLVLKKYSKTDASFPSGCGKEAPKRRFRRLENEQMEYEVVLDEKEAEKSENKEFWLRALEDHLYEQWRGNKALSEERQ